VAAAGFAPFAADVFRASQSSIPSLLHFCQSKKQLSHLLRTKPALHFSRSGRQRTLAFKLENCSLILF
jgi:hypothetical protein